MVIISQQYFLYSPAIFISMNAKSIPTPTRHPPQINILISGMETPNEKCFVSIENLSNAIAKDIRIGDTVEVQGDKILRVLLEKRGGNNAEEKS